MGKPTGFLEWQRHLPKKRAKTERVRDYSEFVPPFTAQEAKEQAGRCMDCGVPFCHQGCPLGNQIPDWNDLVFRDRWKSAFQNLASTNNFPEFTGRLCPAPCEGACVLAINSESVTIEQIEKEIVERAFAEGWVVAQPPTYRSGKNVAVVGSGPAGLAAAAQLNRAGHTVTVLERDDRLGGLLRYGIPDFKIEKAVIDRRLALMEAEGIVFRTGVPVGKSPTWAELKAQYDAVVLATGARLARDLQVPGRELTGVHLAMDYLEQQNRRVVGEAIGGIDAKGRHVIVLGGGDTGSDCIGTAHRQGAASVRQIELLPAPPELRASDNPWPQWPMIFRTSSSQEEGGARDFAVMTKEIVGENGRVRALRAVRVALEGGRISEIPGSEHEIPCDLLILALGFTGPETADLREQLGVKLDPRGNVQVDAELRTSVDGIWAAGDARKGASLIVWAISDGREAARSMDRYLGGGLVRLATKGRDLPFGGR